MGDGNVTERNQYVPEAVGTAGTPPECMDDMGARDGRWARG